jgi:hypothetical protein
MEKYDKFLNRLKEIREYEWSDRTVMLMAEGFGQKGYRENETVLEAIARHMVEAIEE